MNRLRRIVYVSRAVAGVPLSEQRVAGFERRNAQDRITGVLLCLDHRYVQYLEGPPAEVIECFARICADPAHEAVTALLDEAATVRIYDGWSMKMLPPAVIHLDRFRRLIDAVARDRPDAGVEAFELLCDGAAALRRTQAGPAAGA